MSPGAAFAAQCIVRTPAARLTAAGAPRASRLAPRGAALAGLPSMGMGSLGAFNPERFNLNFRGLKAKAKKDGVARLAQSKPFRVSVCAARTLKHHRSIPGHSMR